LLTAELLESEGDYPKAVEQYRQALAKDANLPGARRALGVALMHTSSDEATRMEAQRQFEAELAQNPNDASAEYQLGEIWWLRNQPETALKHFLHALEVQPNFVEALIAAGKVWTARGQPQQAVSLLQKAVQLDPHNEVAHYRLAQAYLKMGNKQQSDKELAEFRRLRAALESLRTIYRQLQERRVTAQTVDP
jgi:tetratricopeptide (TPR) repeat protein